MDSTLLIGGIAVGAIVLFFLGYLAARGRLEKQIFFLQSDLDEQIQKVQNLEHELQQAKKRLKDTETMLKENYAEKVALQERLNGTARLQQELETERERSRALFSQVADLKEKAALMRGKVEQKERDIRDRLAQIEALKEKMVHLVKEALGKADVS